MAQNLAFLSQGHFLQFGILTSTLCLCEVRGCCRDQYWKDCLDQWPFPSWWDLSIAHQHLFDAMDANEMFVTDTVTLIILIMPWLPHNVFGNLWQNGCNQGTSWNNQWDAQGLQLLTGKTHVSSWCRETWDCIRCSSEYRELEDHVGRKLECRT